ncbi:MAG: hypothetical protein JHC78_08375 [Ilumatobacteraceae bacterium]|nr:hypothetical protein [Ilumatobacteraceae bacterium]
MRLAKGVSNRGAAIGGIGLLLSVITVGIFSPLVNADSQAGVCNSGTAVTGTLKVDGVSVETKTTSTYAMTVCRDDRMFSYSIQIGRNDYGVLKEDLTAADAEKLFEVTFTPKAGDVPTTAEGYMRGQTFTIGSTVTIAAKPIVNMSKVDDPDRSCDRKEFTDSVCIARSASRDLASLLIIYVRFDTSSSSSDFSKLTGAMVSSSANLYEVRVSGLCPAESSDTSEGDESVTSESAHSAAFDSTSLEIKMVGPHFKLDGKTLNTGMLEAVIPQATITSCFGGTAEELAEGMSMTRTEAGATENVIPSLTTSTTGLQYITSVANGALTVSVPSMTFSQPTYKMTLKSTAKKLAAKPTVAKPTGVSWKISNKKVTVTAKATKGVTYKVAATLKTGKKTAKTGTCKIASSKVTCSLTLSKGTWSSSLTPTSSGKKGTAATRSLTIK